MPKHKDIKKILIIGSGPSVIGRTGEYDAAATQAISTLKDLEYSVTAINSDMTAMMTDEDMADRVYIEPSAVETVIKISETEQVDAILPIFGGKSGLHVIHQLEKNGFFKTHQMRILGIGKETISLSESKNAFKSTMEKLGIGVIDTKLIVTPETELQEAGQLDFPLVVHPSFSFSETNTRLVFNQEELQSAVDNAFSESIDQQIMVETALPGWQELEVVGLRDRNNQCIIIGHMENVDPLGIHSGDSVCVIPFLTVSKEIQQHLEQLTVKIMTALDAVGVVHIRFALPPSGGAPVVIEANCHFNRCAMLVSRAYGLPLVKFATLLACGMTLKEIEGMVKHPLTPTPGQLEKIAVKFPKWSFDNYVGVEDKLDTRMRATGEALGFGATYKEALLTVFRSLDGSESGSVPQKTLPLPQDDLINALGTPSSQRQFQLLAAMHGGASVEALSEITGISPWFIQQLHEIVELEITITQTPDALTESALMKAAKTCGISDRRLSELTGSTPEAVLDMRRSHEIDVHWIPLSDNKDAAPVYRPSFNELNTPIRATGAGNDPASLLILGSTPHRVGRGTEFDHSCVHASLAVRQKGYRSYILNSCPFSKIMDPGMADRIYYSSLSPEDANAVCDHASTDGVILQFGGHEALAIGKALSLQGVNIYGTSPQTMALMEEIESFRNRMRNLGIAQPDFGLANDLTQARSLGHKFGYPLIIRSTMPNGAPRSIIIHNESSLDNYFAAIDDENPAAQVFLEQFLEYAIEVSADALLDGSDAYIPAVCENIELAGVHEGDSACVIPPYSTALRHVETIEEYIRKIGKELDIKGLFNARFAVYKDTVYLLEAKCRASRTLPFVSKVCRIPMAQMAVRLMLGEKLSHLAPTPIRMPYFCVRESIFPFDKLPEVDPLLGPIMQSTGVVHGLADSFGMAYDKSQQSALTKTPVKGVVLITVTDEDKPSILEPARRFIEIGFTIKATRGTCEFLQKNGISATSVRKLGFGRPHLVDELKTGQIHVVINTPSGKESQEDDAHIRKAAIRYGIPNITTPAGALAAAKGIEARLRSRDEIKSLQEYYRELT